MEHGKVLGMQNLGSEAVLLIGGKGHLLVLIGVASFWVAKVSWGWRQAQQWLWWCASVVWAEYREGCSSSGWQVTYQFWLVSDLLLVVEVHWSCWQDPEVNWQGSRQFGPGERYQETESKEGYSKHWTFKLQKLTLISYLKMICSSVILFLFLFLVDLPHILN